MTTESSIKAIDAGSVHRITSGQVVIDLQTAVKELVENSLDASATNIEVRFKQYGLASVEVIDNGSGIAREDYDSVALKHHTSKLTNFTDLTTLLSFGFRGEALSSLCALCEGVSLTTSREEEAPVGAELKFDRRGHLKGRDTVARQRGTTVTLTNLFMPLAVRRKELERNIKREFGKALNLLNAYALGPCTTPKGGPNSSGVRLTVSNQSDGGKKTVQIRTDGTTSQRSAISALWGPKAMANVVDIDLRFGVENSKTALKRISALSSTDADISTPASLEVRVSGLTSKFSVGCGRTGTDRQFFYVNGRPCSLPKVQKAINEVYRTFSANQSPFLLLDFTLPTASCDINVSPDKRTIFIHSEDNLIDALKAALEKNFASSRSTYDVAASQLVQSQLPVQTSQKTPSAGRRGTRSGPLPEEEPAEAGTEDEAEEPPRPLPRARKRDNQAHVEELQDTPMDVDAEPPTPTAMSASRPSHSSEKMVDVIAATTTAPTDHNPETIIPLDDQEVLTSSQPSTSSSFQPSNSLLSFTADDDDNLPSTPPTSNIGVGLSGDETRISPAAHTPDGPRQTSSMSSSVVIIPGYRFDRRKLASSSSLSSASPVPSRRREGQLNQTTLDTSQAFWNKRKSVVVTDDDAIEEEERADADLPPPRKKRRPSFIPDGDVGSQTSTRRRGSSTASRASTTSDAIDIDGPDEIIEPDAAGVHARRDVRHSKDAEVAVKQEPSDSSLPTRKKPDDTVEYVRSDVFSDSFTLRCDISRLEKIYAEFALGQQLQLSQSLDDSDCPKVPPDAGVANVDDEKAADALSRVIDKDDFADMEIVGQFNLGFIIVRRRKVRDAGLDVEDDLVDMMDDLFIVDQHAADEKYNFETLQQKTIIQSQRLIRPLALELTAADELLTVDNMEVLKRNGFEIEVDDEMGVGQKLKLIAQPMSKSTVFDVKDLEELVHLMHDQPVGRMVRCSKARSMFAMRACRKSVMIGMALNKNQMTTVVRHMGTMDQPWNCPHGRPTMRHLSDMSGVKKKWSEREKSRRVDWAKLPLAA